MVTVTLPEVQPEEIDVGETFRLDREEGGASNRICILCQDRVA